MNMGSRRELIWIWITIILYTTQTFVSSSSKTFGSQSNVKDFARTIGSIDPNVSSVNYLNGSVFGKRPGEELQKLFNFEGYNINRKLPQPDGSYLSLSREFVVYRDPITSIIQSVWMNPWTSEPNEIFFVANDPVNAVFPADLSMPTVDIQGDRIVFNSDIVLEYPNPLSPSIYGNYSAGNRYDAAELFGFFTNNTYLVTSQDKSVPMTGTWIRKSQYLPWMEMSNSPGGLYYTTMAWKCNDGLSCVTDDVMKLIKEHYSKYETAPTKDEEPNETSWTAFKKTVDARRSAGLPDILIPEMNVTDPLPVMTTSIESRVQDVLYSYPMYVSLNGTVWSQIPGNQSMALFDVMGRVSVDVEPIPVHGGYRVQLDGQIDFQDATTKENIIVWKNPFTGKTNIVQNPTRVATDLVVKKDFAYTMDIPTSSAIGLLAAQSYEGQGQNTGNWSVNFADIIFEYSELAKYPLNRAFFYGTVGGFSNWFDWMQMDDIEGNLVMKATVARRVFG